MQYANLPSVTYGAATRQSQRSTSVLVDHIVTEVHKISQVE